LAAGEAAWWGSLTGTLPGSHLRLGGFDRLPEDVLPDFTYLAGQVLLHVFPPHEPARTVFVGTIIQAGQLFPPFPNQRVQPHEFGCKVRCLSRFAIRYHESGD
jgi:hypothetical protein